MSDETLRRYVRLLDSSVVRVNSVDGNRRLRALFRGRRLQVASGTGWCQLARAQWLLRCPRHVARWWRLIQTVQWLLPGDSTDRSEVDKRPSVEIQHVAPFT